MVNANSGSGASRGVNTSLGSSSVKDVWEHVKQNGNSVAASKPNQSLKKHFVSQSNLNFGTDDFDVFQTKNPFADYLTQQNYFHLNRAKAKSGDIITLEQQGIKFARAVDQQGIQFARIVDLQGINFDCAIEIQPKFNELQNATYNTYFSAGLICLFLLIGILILFFL